MPFPILDPVQPTPYEGLNDDQKMKIVDLYADGANATELKHSKEVADLNNGQYLPTSVAKGAMQSLGNITTDCESLMLGQVFTPQITAQYNESAIEIVTVVETGQTFENAMISDHKVYSKETEEVLFSQELNTPPETIAELKTEAIKLHPDCTNPAFDYTIDVMVSKMTTEGTWEAYKNYFDNL